MSTRPSHSLSPLKRTTRSRMNGSIAATSFGVKAAFASRRTRVCAGGSTSASLGIARKPPSSSVRAAIGQGWRSGEFAFAAENCPGQESPLTTLCVTTVVSHVFLRLNRINENRTSKPCRFPDFMAQPDALTSLPPAGCGRGTPTRSGPASTKFRDSSRLPV
jgi:hypothetical protein